MGTPSDALWAEEDGTRKGNQNRLVLLLMPRKGLLVYEPF